MENYENENSAVTRQAELPEELQALVEEPIQMETAALAATTTTAAAAAASESSSTYKRDYLDAPFRYQHMKHENVLLTSGAIGYQATDLHLPGRHGLDLVLSRYYDSSRAKGAEFYYYYNGAVEDVWDIRTDTRSAFQMTPPIGSGWCLSLPAIEYEIVGDDDRPRYIHMGDGHIYKIDYLRVHSNNKVTNRAYLDTTLSGFTLDVDVDNGTVQTKSIGGVNISYYCTMTHRDGTCYYFDTSRILAIENRFGDSILYQWSGSNLTITDSYGRQINLEQRAPGMVISGLPNGMTIQYTIAGNQLTQVTNQQGYVTRYQYEAKEIHAMYGKENSDKEKTITYTPLTTVTHPTGAVTRYTYKIIKKSWGTKGLYAEYLDLTSRADYLSAAASEEPHNQESYSFSRLDGGRVTSATITRQTQPGANTGKLVTTHFFDRYGLRTQKTTALDGVVTDQVKFEYTKRLVTREQWVKPVAKNSYYIYDSYGYPLTSTDALGHVTTMTYGAYGQMLTKVWSQNGVTMTMKNTLRADHKVIECSQMLMGTELKELTGFEYNSSWELVKKLCYTKNLNLKNNYLSTEYEYAHYNSQPSSIIYARGTYGLSKVYEKSTFDWWGRITDKKVAHENSYLSTLYSYDSLGRLLKETLPDRKNTKTYTYLIDSASGRNWITYTNEMGHTMRYEYNSLGEITCEREDPATPGYREADSPMMRYTYDTLGRLITETRKLNAGTAAVTSLTYDYNDRIISRKIQQGTATLRNEGYAYNDEAMTQTFTLVGDSNAPTVTTIITYNKLGQIVQKNIGGSIWQYSYDSAGNQLTETDPAGGVTRREFDFAGRVLKETNPLGHSRSITYNTLGQMSASSDWKGQETTYVYNALGHRIQIFRPGISLTAMPKLYSYDFLGRLTAESVNNKGSWYRYDDMGRVTSTGPLGDWGGMPVKSNEPVPCGDTYFEYDAAGRRTAMYHSAVYGKNIYSHKTAYTYDRLGRLLTTVDPIGNLSATADKAPHTERMSYDSGGRLIQKTDRVGNITSYSYDGLDRLLREDITSPGGAGLGWRRAVYGLTGQLVEEENETMWVRYHYNAKGQLVTKQEQTGATHTYAYDAAGRRTGYTLVINGTQQLSAGYGYDKAGRLLSVSKSGTEVARFTYDQNGSRLSAVYQPAGLTVNYSYNNAGLPSLLEAKRGTAVVYRCGYSYQDDYMLASKTVTGGAATAYTYDYVNRLAGEVVTLGTAVTRYGYQYDWAGNRFKQHYSLSQNGVAAAGYIGQYRYDRCNRLLGETRNHNDGSVSQSLYRYDGNGNQIRLETRRRDSGGKEALVKLEETGYNGRNQAVSVKVTRPNAAGTATTNATTTYRWRPDGLRHKKVTAGATSKTRTHIWDGMQLVLELNESNAVAGRYWHGIGPFAIELDGKLQYLMTDTHGDVVKRLDTSGNILKSYVYDAFGVEQDVNTLDPCPFRYCGEYYDEETETIYLRARSYRPGTGGFITEDPAQSGSNWYGYCANNPVMFVDPSGLKSSSSDDILKKVITQSVNPHAARNASLEGPRRLDDGDPMSVVMSIIRAQGKEAEANALWNPTVARLYRFTQPAQIHLPTMATSPEYNYRGHTGVDFGSNYDTAAGGDGSIFAIERGFVIEAVNVYPNSWRYSGGGKAPDYINTPFGTDFNNDGGNAPFFANRVVIRSGDYDTYYAHMSSEGMVPVGVYVLEGDVIGIMGKTGNAGNGTHLHLERRPSGTVASFASGNVATYKYASRADILSLLGMSDIA